jgi:hypothetical protein
MMVDPYAHEFASAASAGGMQGAGVDYADESYLETEGMQKLQLKLIVIAYERYCVWEESRAQTMSMSRK